MTNEINYAEIFQAVMIYAVSRHEDGGYLEDEDYKLYKLGKKYMAEGYRVKVGGSHLVGVTAEDTAPINPLYEGRVFAGYVASAERYAQAWLFQVAVN